MADNYWGNTARAVLGQGLAMGWGDELEAKIRTMSGDETYEEELAMIANSYDPYAEENPRTAIGGEIAGSFLPTVAAYAAAPFTGGATAPLAIANTARIAALANKARQVFNNPMGRSMITGATSGTVSGAGTADEGNRGYGALQGLTFGLGLGTALPILTRGGGSMLRAVRDKITESGVRIEKGALRRIYDKLSRDGGTPEDVYNQYMRDIELGVPSRLGAYNSGTTGQLDTLAATEAAADIIEPRLRKVQLEAGDRIVDQTDKLFGGVNYVDALEDITERLKSKAATLYDDAFSFGAVDDPRILRLLEHPDMAEAFKRAQKIASREKEAAVALGQDGSKFDLIPYDVAMDGGKAVAKVLPDVRTLDYMKRAFQDMIDSGYSSGGAGAADAGSLKKMKNALVDVLDEATEVDGVSAYRTARKMYAGDKEIQNALEEGLKNFKSIKPEELAKKFKDYGSGEREAWMIGANRYLIDIINNTTGNANFAQRIIGGRNTRKKLDIMFPGIDDAGASLYKAALLREAQLFGEIGGTLMNSKTARRQSGQADMMDTDSVMEEALLGLKSLDTKLVDMVGNFLLGKNTSAKMKQKMAEMLMSDNPEQVAAVVDSLTQFGKNSKVTNRALTGIETGLSSAGAQLPDTEQGTSRPEGQRDKLRTSARAKVEEAETPKPEFDANSTELLSMEELYPNNPEVWDIE